MKNTKRKGILRFFTYYDSKDREYVGFCIELGIIKTGKDLNEVKKDLINASIGYVGVVKKEKMPDKLLNQKPPSQYMDLFNKYQLVMNSDRRIRQGTNLRDSISADRVDTFVRDLGSLCPAI